MNKNKKIFLRKAEAVAFDLEHRRKIRFNIGKYEQAVEKGLKRYRDFELARDLASLVKDLAINNLDDYLREFIEKAEANGIEVYFASDEREALDIIEHFVDLVGAKLVVKSKSMTTEEIGLNEFLERKGVEVLETDLGEFIVQQAGEKPYHIVTPAMHKSKQDIIRLYHEKFGLPLDSDVNEITAFTREYLREKFQQADIGITGANFLVADVGGIALTENEGNAFMSFSFPRVHIAISGIEKIIPSIDYLGFMWQILANRGTGQSITVYSNIVRGPRKAEEENGPERMILILLDNGRSRILEYEDRKEVLKCIRCGACLNVCPVYKNIGGYTYASVYSGPIGSVLTPFFKGFKEFGHLSFACTICRKCEEVCPVRLHLADMMLLNRKDYVEAGLADPIEQMAMNSFAVAVKNSKLFQLFPPWLENFMVKLVEGKLWDRRRAFPKFRKPFRKQFSKVLKDN